MKNALIISNIKAPKSKLHGLFSLRIPFFITALMCIISTPALSLTLDEAISLAKENLPSYKASGIKIRSSEALYDASLSPYLPGIDLSASYERNFILQEEYSSNVHGITLSYTLFDGGKRKANRSIAFLNLDTYREELRKRSFDLEYNVKAAFHTVIAGREILSQRKIQLQDALKDYEVAEGRHKFGVAKLSDVLQASVRLEQARYNLVEAEGDFRKSLFELSSLIGKPLESENDIKGSLDVNIHKVIARQKDFLESLTERTLQKPEIKQAEDSIKISENNKYLALSDFYPTISLSASYTNSSGSIYRASYPGYSDGKTLSITATWNIFSLEKFYKKKSSELEKYISIENMKETERQLLLEVRKTYEDLITASNKFRVAQEQLRQAEHNYSQAFGEYKAGKADILSLVQAESLLSEAREQVISSRLKLVLSKALLEKAAGIGRLESLPK